MIGCLSELRNGVGYIYLALHPRQAESLNKEGKEALISQRLSSCSIMNSRIKNFEIIVKAI